MFFFFLLTDSVVIAMKGWEVPFTTTSGQLEGSLHRLLQNDGMIHECNIGLFDRLWAVNNESFRNTKQYSQIRYVYSMHYRMCIDSKWNDSLDEQTSLIKTESKLIL